MCYCYVKKYLLDFDVYIMTTAFAVQALSGLDSIFHILLK